MIDLPTIHRAWKKQDRSLSPGRREGDVHTSLPAYYRDLGFDYHVEADETNTTLRMIQNFMATKKIESRYLRPEEMRYLNRHVEYAVLFAKNSKKRSMSCIFKKVKE